MHVIDTPPYHCMNLDLEMGEVIPVFWFWAMCGCHHELQVLMNLPLKSKVFIETNYSLQ